MLKSDKQRVKGGQSAKFGYLSMMSVTTLGVLNAESCHASDESRIHGVQEENLPKHTLVGIQDH